MDLFDNKRSSPALKNRWVHLLAHYNCQKGEHILNFLIHFHLVAAAHDLDD